MARRQAELEAKLRRMEDALKRAETKPVQRTSEEEGGPRSPAPSPFVNIAGTWRDPAGTSWIIQQNGPTVTFQELNPILGVTAVGQGTLAGQELQLNYQSAMQTTGKALLIVSRDGRRLSGNAQDFTTGAAFPLTFSR